MSVARLDEIRRALGDRELVWFGTRGIDALPLARLERLALVVGQIAPIEDSAALGFRQDNLELRSRLRRDLDRYDIDGDHDIDAESLKREFLARIDAPVVMVAYRAHEFLSRPSFCLPDLFAAVNFHLSQRQFEHKPWVERQLAGLDGVPALRSTFLRDSDFATLAALLKQGPMVGRCATGSGGAGVFTFETEDEYSERLPPHFEGFVGVAPFLTEAAPLNLNACVYRDGGVRAFGASYQLIGLGGMTRRQFGFCGNDFAAAAQLPPASLREIERILTNVGRWLRGFNYVGVFGLDMLYDRGTLHVIELNARFQASTPLAARIHQTIGLPDPLTEHVAAFLGLGAPDMPGLDQQVMLAAAQEHGCPVAQVIHRNLSTGLLRSLGRNPGFAHPGVEIEGAPTLGIHVEAEAMVFKSLHHRQVTTDGYSVAPEVEGLRDAVELAIG